MDDLNLVFRREKRGDRTVVMNLGDTSTPLPVDRFRWGHLHSLAF